MFLIFKVEKPIKIVPRCETLSASCHLTTTITNSLCDTWLKTWLSGELLRSSQIVLLVFPSRPSEPRQRPISQRRKAELKSGRPPCSGQYSCSGNRGKSLKTASKSQQKLPFSSLFFLPACLIPAFF